MLFIACPINLNWEQSQGYKRIEFQILTTLHMFLTVSTSILKLWLINLLFDHLKLVFHWKKSKSSEREDQAGK